MMNSRPGLSRNLYKLMTLLIVGVTLLSLVACGAKPTPTAPPTYQAQPTPIPPTPVPPTPTPIPPTPTPEPVTLDLVWYGPTPLEKGLVEDMIARFQASHPNITIKLNHIPDARGWQEKVQVMIAGGTPPDISQMTFAVYGDWAKANLFLDLGPYIDADPDVSLDDFMSNQVEPFKVGGKTYGLAYSWNVMALYYNKAVFDAAGQSYPPANPDEAWDWDTFVKVAQKLTVDKNGKHADEAGFDKDQIVQWGIDALHLDFNIIPFTWSNGGDWFSSDGTKATFDNPAVVESLQDYVDLEAKYHVSPTSAETTGTGMNQYQLLQQGRIAMLPFGTWTTLQFAGQNFGWGVAPLPKYKTPSTYINPDSMVIYSSTKHPKECWEFVKFMVSEEQQIAFSKSGLVMPTLKSLYTADGFKKWLNPTVHPADYEASIGTYTSKYGRLPIIPPGYSKVFWSLLIPGLGAAWNGSKTVQDVITTVMPDITAALESAKK